MRKPPLLPTITLAVLLATATRPGLDTAAAATAKPAPVVSETTAAPAIPPPETSAPAEEPEPTDESGTTDSTDETVTASEEAPIEAEVGSEAETSAEAEPAPASEPETDGEPTDPATATAETESPSDAPSRAGAPGTTPPPGPAGAMRAEPGGHPAPTTVMAPAERPSLLHRTPPSPGSPPTPPPKAEALPRPPRPATGEGSAQSGPARPAAPVRAATPDGAGDPPRTPSAAGGDRGLPSLASLTATRERPLFVVGRRGPEQRGAAVVTTMEPAEPSAEVEPTDAPFTAVLGGVVSGPGLELAILVDPSTNVVRRVKRGEDHDGWTLAELDRRTATFRRGDERAVLKLKPPGSTVVSGGAATTGEDETLPEGRKPPPRPRGGHPPATETGEE